MQNQYFLGLVFIVFFLACTKIEDDPSDPCKDCCPPDCDSTNISTIWKSALHESIISISNRGLLYENGRLFLNAAASKGILLSYSATDGDFLWEWQEFDDVTFSSVHLLEHSLLLKINNKIGKVDKLTGQTQIKIENISEKASNPYGELIGDYYYVTTRSLSDSTAKVLRSNKHDLQNWEEVYSLERGIMTGGSIPQIQSYNIWVNPSNGDSVLILQHRMFAPNRVDVVAWNMNNQSIEWKHERINNNGNSNHNQILLINDKAYMGGSTAYYCFNMFNGQIEWEFASLDPLGSLLVTRTLFVESSNSLIIRTIGNHLVSLDASTGTMNWIIDSLGTHTPGSGSPVYLDGVIYIISNEILYAIRESNGSVLWQEKSSGNPLGDSRFRGEIAIDPEKKIIYVTTTTELFAIRAYQE